jgi:hypothetical protein
MVGDLEVSPISPPSRTVCPASPSLPWVAWASLPHLPRYCAPLRLPAALLGSLRVRSLPNTLSASWVCVPSRARWAAEASTQRQGSWSAGPPALPAVLTRRPWALPSSRGPPLATCSALLRPRWCPARLAVALAGLLPSTRARVSAFSPASMGIIRWTTTIHISGPHNAACRLAPPGFVPPLARLHAGSLLSGWLGVAQVGLESVDSHPLGNSDLFPEVPSIP